MPWSLQMLLPCLLIAACANARVPAPESHAVEVSDQPHELANEPIDEPVTEPAEELASSAPEVLIRLEMGRPLRLSESVELELLGIVAETIAESPVDPKSYPAGSGHTVSLRFSSDQQEGVQLELSRFSAGYPSREVLWVHGVRVELRQVEDAAVLLRVDRMGEPLPTIPAQQLTIMKGQDRPLTERLALRLIGHGHKSVMAGGPPSPLMVSLLYTTIDGQREPQDVSLSEGQGWRWRDFDFVVTGFRYDESMDLEVYRLEHLPLRPVSSMP